MASGKGGQEMAGLDQGIHRLVEIPDKDHGGIGVDRVPSPGEGTGGHVVLHDLHAVLVLKGDPRHLVKGHHVPKPHKSHVWLAML